MRFLRQMSIILLISTLGELLRGVIPLPIPAGIYGFVILFGSLCTGIIKLPQVDKTGDILVEIMQVLLLPACVELMVYWDVLKQQLPALLAIIVISTVAVIITTGKVSDIIIVFAGREKK